MNQFYQFGDNISILHLGFLVCKKLDTAVVLLASTLPWSGEQYIAVGGATCFTFTQRFHSLILIAGVYQRMESIGTSKNVMQGKSTQRRAWTIFEEESLLTVFEDFVANGHWELQG
ncbi:hypothetical protein ACOSQ4_024601 [Xanthoceras sorbifolium]